MLAAGAVAVAERMQARARPITTSAEQQDHVRSKAADACCGDGFVPPRSRPEALVVMQPAVAAGITCKDPGRCTESTPCRRPRSPVNRARHITGERTTRGAEVPMPLPGDVSPVALRMNNIARRLRSGGGRAERRLTRGG